MKKYIFLIPVTLFVFVLNFSIWGQDIKIIPQPASMSIGRGSFVLNKYTVIVVRNGVDDNSADFLISYIKDYYGIKLKKSKSATRNFIELTTLQTFAAGKEGAYTLSSMPNNIIIHGQTAS